MSILDGMPQSEAEWDEVLNLAKPFVKHLEENLEMTSDQRKAWDLVNQGIPLADIYGITKQEREAVLAHCCRMIKRGQTKQARELLRNLFILYPHDARVLYTAGVTLQLEGDIPGAAKVFSQATAMDATNPEGYLRLGECFLTAKEYENAGAAFEAAQHLHERGYGTARTAQYAEKMLAHVVERVNANNEDARG